MRWLLGIVVALCILLAIYIASPLIALHSIASAVESKNAVALTERIDFPSVRRSFRRQIVATYLELTGKKLPLGAMSRRLAVSVADPIVARLMTIRALLDLLGKGDAEVVERVQTEAPFTADAFKSSWRLWLNSTYAGRDFYIRLPPKSSPNDQFEIHLRLIRWRWMSVAIELPQELRKKLTRELVESTKKRFESSP
jgi:Protein of unknown function (DUF2939)